MFAAKAATRLYTALMVKSGYLIRFTANARYSAT